MIYAFIGPSIRREEAERLIDATFLPPVSQGDVAALIDARPSAIVIVDGYFEWTPAVWHKEILFALSAGVRVYGASSMGALRAAELDAFGMVGVGQIYQWYRDGIIEDDDEVAVLHGPADASYIPLSVPMVDLRATMHKAREAGAVDAEMAQRAIEVAKKCHYTRRSYEVLFDGLAEDYSSERVAALRRWVDANAVFQKRDDAIAVLTRAANDLREGVGGANRSFVFEDTRYWRELLEDLAKRNLDRQRVEQRHLLMELMFLPHLRRTLEESAIRLILARAVPGAISKSEVTAEVKRLMRETGAADAAVFSRSLAASGVSEPQTMAYLEDRARISKALDPASIQTEMIRELKLRGYEGELTRSAERRAQVDPGDGLSDEGAITWYFGEIAGEPVPADIEAFAKRHAFVDESEFRALIARERAVRKC